MATRLMQTYSGNGALYSGDEFLADAQYGIEVYQQFHEGRMMDGSFYSIPGLKSITGQLTTTPDFALSLSAMRDKFVLHMDTDGLLLEILLTPYGRITGTGPFRRSGSGEVLD